MASADDAPLVTRPPAARPGLFDGTLLTVAFAVVLFGTLIVIVVGGFLALAAAGDPAADAPPDGKPNSVSSLPPALVSLLAWSFPLGYLAGLLFTLIVFRVVVGRGWTREVGLRRLPPVHLGLALLALPAFVILSDGLAQLLFRLFGMEEHLDQSGQLGELFAGFHPAFVLLAVGVGPGVVEELWCRGLLGRGYVGRYGWVGGVALSSLFFGLLHLYPPPYVLVTAAMGACLHFAYACSRSLWVPVAVHVANNGFAGLAAVGAVPIGGLERALASYPIGLFALAAVVLVSCGLAAWSARAAATGPRGVMVPPGGVSDAPAGRVPVALAVVSGVALIGLLATG
ncbi:CPBP family intramembrane glutamic endopeptidase [Urbifossiella limnaea]|uniref:CAAX amino terminal protease self-immunity n=1 Tax=Urbifossiella limnaea TaxID=2528023 RepID=A0A517XVP7_9BACT|nr:type II CAAX endopeptidase family protein [Urbifossiella limnaea]QDU21569.1 CAAX amino terminal protease self- immunity [Urbifossiella limnaea]